jgi:hypothetical protein
LFKPNQCDWFGDCNSVYRAFRMISVAYEW